MKDGVSKAIKMAKKKAIKETYLLKSINMKSGENGLIGPGSNDYGRKPNPDDFDLPRNLNNKQSKQLSEILAGFKENQREMDRIINNYTKALTLLSACENVLNDIPRTKLSGSMYKDSYELVAAISKFRREL